MLAAGVAMVAVAAAGVYVYRLHGPAIGGAPGRAGGASAGYTGSSACRSCHAQFYALWSTSHHGLAMQPFTSDLAKRSLPPQLEPIAIGERRYRADTAAGEVVEESAGRSRRYPIQWVMGGKNVFYLLTPLERGRLQVLPVAFDLGTRAWFDTALSAVRHLPNQTDRPLDWTDRAFTFNTSCYGCHVSQIAKNYDPATDSYRTTWTEPGINCESCHGPAAEHVGLMKSLPSGQKPADPRIIVTRRLTPDQMNDLCATCHAKAPALTGSFRPGDRFFDHYDLATLENADFYPDGRDLGENYTFTSWLMSPCLASGRLDCNKCHTPSGRMRLVGDRVNEACLPCHADQVKSVAEHSHHPAGSPGSRCFDCHMPKTTFALMARSDHSMRPPAPAATLAFGSPNACNLCHSDRDARWADALVRQWSKRDLQKPLVEQAALIDSARKRDWSRLGAMLAEIERPGAGAIEKTALLRLLDGCEDPRKWPVLLARLKDPSPLVRSAAAAGLAGAPSPDVARALVSATADSYRLVRIRAAQALAGRPLEGASDEQRAALGRAMAELEASLSSRPDDWSQHFNLGNLLAERGDQERALTELEQAARLEPKTILPLVNAALVASALGRNDQAEASLRRALVLEPESPAAHLNLGLLLAETGRAPDAERELRRALELDGTLAAAAYNLCVLVSQDRAAEGLSFCRRAAALRPDDPRYAYTLAFYVQAQDPAEAMRLLRQVVSRAPGYADAYLLMAGLFEASRDRRSAAEVLRRGLAERALTPADRARLERKLAELAPARAGVDERAR